MFKSIFLSLFLLLLSLHFLLGCQNNKNRVAATADLTFNKEQFGQYWFDGLAEVNTYQLTQNRYGTLRQGSSVMIFVTEDFSKKKQVKLDNPEAAGKDRIAILKLNDLRKFVTGIYDYSLMTSVFTPVELRYHPYTLKTTNTNQDWCGHTFQQINLNQNKYNIEVRSYFETESDEEINLPVHLLEDEIWTRLRINPKSIPSGKIDLIPSAYHLRLMHKPTQPEKATITFSEKDKIGTCSIQYLENKRNLNINYEINFPHQILSWEETIEGKVQSNGKLLKSVRTDYWKKNTTESLPWRDTLQIFNSY